MLSILTSGGCFSSSGLRGDAASDTERDPIQEQDHFSDSSGDLNDLPEISDMAPDVLWDGSYECIPPSEVTADFILDDSRCPAGPDEKMDWEFRCFVSFISGDPGQKIVEFICPSEDGGETYLSIELHSSPPIYFPLEEGMDVVYRFAVEATEPCCTWFKLSYPDGRLLMAGVDAGSLTPFEEDPFSWYTPLSVRTVDGLCPAEPMECYDHERMALDATYEEEAVRIFDAHVGSVGAVESYQLTIEEASKRSNIRCENTTITWYKALFVFVP